MFTGKMRILNLYLSILLGWPLIGNTLVTISTDKDITGPQADLSLYYNIPDIYDQCTGGNSTITVYKAKANEDFGLKTIENQPVCARYGTKVFGPYGGDCQLKVKEGILNQEYTDGSCECLNKDQTKCAPCPDCSVTPATQ